MKYREVLPGVYSPSKSELGLAEEVEEKMVQDGKKEIIVLIIIAVMVTAFIVMKVYVEPLVDMNL